MILPRPSEFAALIPDPNAPVCDQLRNFFEFQRRWSEYYALVYNEDMTFTTDYTALLCAAGCPGGIGGGETNTSSSGAYPGSSVAYATSRFISNGNWHSRLFSINTASTWTYQTINADIQQYIIGLAVSPSDSTLWAIYSDIVAEPYPNTYLKLGTVNTTTGAITFVANMNTGGVNWLENFTSPGIAMTFKPDGTLICGTAGGFSNRLYTVDTTTGAVTQIGTYLYLLGGGSTFVPTALSYNLSGTLIALGIDNSTGFASLASINLVPDINNLINATVLCAVDQNVGHTINKWLLNKNGQSVGVVDYIPYFYAVANSPGACIDSGILKMVGPSTMNNMIAVAGIPS